MSDDLKNIFLQKPEKRNYARVDAKLDVRLELSGKSIQTKTANISCGGMFLPDLPEPDQKTDIVAFINLPERIDPVRVPSQVCRVVPSSETGPGGIAFEFNKLIDDNRLEIDRFVKRLKRLS